MVVKRIVAVNSATFAGDFEDYAELTAFASENFIDIMSRLAPTSFFDKGLQFEVVTYLSFSATLQFEIPSSPYVTYVASIEHSHATISEFPVGMKVQIRTISPHAAGFVLNRSTSERHGAEVDYLVESFGVEVDRLRGAEEEEEKDVHDPLVTP